ncbi:MAG: DUF1343 domain-containing protein [Candidatus Marinimicrobia bacterium CG_4_9_14_3_um_filter_48_9]|nr:MAG: DUF1343 domain-containing protein [Candidatus Marinimicrobia bacterium CG_4_9_14_3_um_filter_48_9]
MNHSSVFLKFSVGLNLLLLLACTGNQPDVKPHSHQQQEMVAVQKPIEIFPVLTGIDVLERINFAPIQGKTVAVVCNHTALDKQGRHLVDILYESPDVTLKAIFAPEHGFRGVTEGGFDINDSLDQKTGAMIYSIYGDIRKPTAQMLNGVDMIIFDIQDVGARFYTYISTMGNVMEAGAELGIPVMILDRPNPISGFTDGNILDLKFQSFVGMFPIPIQHGMTVGELARMIQGEGWINQAADLDLRIVKNEGWSRDLFFNETDLKWVDPSPNMRNLNEALIYPGMCLLEANICAEGRGTDKPFEWVGAPFIDGKQLATALYAGGLEGATVEPISFVPRDMPGRAVNPKFEGQKVNGIQIRVTEPMEFQPVQFGVKFLVTVKRLYPRDFKWVSESRAARLWGSETLVQMIAAGKSADDIIASYQPELDQFKLRQQRYLLYRSSRAGNL